MKYIKKVKIAPNFKIEFEILSQGPRKKFGPKIKKIFCRVPWRALGKVEIKKLGTKSPPAQPPRGPTPAPSHPPAPPHPPQPPPLPRPRRRAPPSRPRTTASFFEDGAADARAGQGSRIRAPQGPNPGVRSLGLEVLLLGIGLGEGWLSTAADAG